MFTSPDVPLSIQRVTLKLDEETNEPKRLALCTFVLGYLTPMLAHEMGEHVASHLFEHDADESPKAEVQEVGFNLGLGLMKLSVRETTDIETQVVLENVRVSKVRVKRDPKFAILTLQFVAEINVDTRANRDFVVAQFGKRVHVSFEAMPEEKTKPKQRGLPGGIGRAVADLVAPIASGKYGSGGSLTISTPGRDPVTIDSETAQRILDRTNG